MISDILSDCAASIREHLETCDAYRDMPPHVANLIYTALVAMDEARIELDTPPSDEVSP